jgi:hypothetical protein
MPWNTSDIEPPKASRTLNRAEKMKFNGSAATTAQAEFATGVMLSFSESIVNNSVKALGRRGKRQYLR